MLLVSVNVSLIQTNRSLSVIAGNDVTLPCRRNVVGPARWLYIKSELSSQDVISKDKSIQSNYTDRATVDQTAQDYNLLLSNVQLNLSGFYICIEDGLLLFKTPMLLTVSGKLCYGQLNIEQSDHDLSASQNLPFLDCRRQLRTAIRNTLH